MKNSKKIISVILTLALLVSCLCLQSFSTSATTQSDETTTLRQNIITTWEKLETKPVTVMTPGHYYDSDNTVWKDSDLKTDLTSINATKDMVGTNYVVYNNTQIQWGRDKAINLFEQNYTNYYFYYKFASAVSSGTKVQYQLQTGNVTSTPTYITGGADEWKKFSFTKASLNDVVRENNTNKMTEINMIKVNNTENAVDITLGSLMGTNSVTLPEDIENMTFAQVYQEASELDLETVSNEGTAKEDFKAALSNAKSAYEKTPEFVVDSALAKMEDLINPQPVFYTFLGNDGYCLPSLYDTKADKVEIYIADGIKYRAIHSGIFDSGKNAGYQVRIFTDYAKSSVALADYQELYCYHNPLSNSKYKITFGSTGEKEYTAVTEGWQRLDLKSIIPSGTTSVNEVRYTSSTGTDSTHGHVTEIYGVKTFEKEYGFAKTEVTSIDDLKSKVSNINFTKYGEAGVEFERYLLTIGVAPKEILHSIYSNPQYKDAVVASPMNYYIKDGSWQNITNSNAEVNDIKDATQLGKDVNVNYNNLEYIRFSPEQGDNFNPNAYDELYFYYKVEKVDSNGVVAPSSTSDSKEYGFKVQIQGWKNGNSASTQVVDVADVSSFAANVSNGNTTATTEWKKFVISAEAINTAIKSLEESVGEDEAVKWRYLRLKITTPANASNIKYSIGSLMGVKKAPTTDTLKWDTCKYIYEMNEINADLKYDITSVLGDVKSTVLKAGTKQSIRQNLLGTAKNENVDYNFDDDIDIRDLVRIAQYEETES